MKKIMGCVCLLVAGCGSSGDPAEIPQGYGEVTMPLRDTGTDPDTGLTGDIEIRKDTSAPGNCSSTGALVDAASTDPTETSLSFVLRANRCYGDLSAGRRYCAKLAAGWGLSQLVSGDGSALADWEAIPSTDLEIAHDTVAFRVCTDVPTVPHPRFEIVWLGNVLHVGRNSVNVEVAVEDYACAGGCPTTPTSVGSTRCVILDGLGGVPYASCREQCNTVADCASGEVCLDMDDGPGICSP